MKWQPIETAPKDGTRVLLFDKFNREHGFARFVGFYAVIEDKWIALPGGYGKKPTHWMPLPAAPE